MKPWRLLLWIGLAGLVCGLLGLGQIAEDVLRTGRNSLHWHKASGDIVIVKIDNRSLQQVGKWPWPRREMARLIDELSEARVNRIFLDIQFTGATNPEDDLRLSNAMRRSKNVVLAVPGVPTPGTAERTGAPNQSIFMNDAELASIRVNYNYQNAVWRLPYATSYKGGSLPSFGALLGGRSGPASSSFLIDYSLDPTSIPAVSASDIISGGFNADRLRGKDVLVGWTTDVLGDIYFLPGTGQMGGVYVHALAAETLKSGKPVALGWIPIYLLSLGICALLLFRKRETGQGIIMAGAIIAVLFGPVLAEMQLISVDVVPGLLLLLVTSFILIRRRFNRRGLVDAVSGLPNLTALKAFRSGQDKALIVARVLNYAEVAATLPPSGERELIEQIVSRLSVGAQQRTHYHGDGGIFAWFDEPTKPFGHHLEALYALFRNPVRVGGLPIDLAISFGVEIGSSRSMANRLGSALVAAEEAAHDGLKWKFYDPDALQNASWKLSMLSQLDEAIDRNEVWVAYQPQVDLKSRRIIGAEALARWTHPTKGPIAASEFVAAAEQNDRIGKLTAFVLDQALHVGAMLNKGHAHFNISVNLSGRMLSDRGLVGRVAIALEQHGLDPGRLTLELTETAALAGSGDAIEVLTQLRDLGIKISIDDYGTGLSTLDYLKRIPAAEIKIDQSFIKGMTENRSERLMVQSTIALAHSLGRSVVAEGVESRDALELLAEMECDVAQGFIVGRPMSFESIRRRLQSDRPVKVA
ncbi:EAL domain-containing protein [Sphingomonas sinipercae]|uniref:EAL domain-containing protein n=1 Tax=Sphingomonas sinipercae TaxID=2714944 RepID=A0A6G7ZNA2_9SPHN|nr:EAL domain-containing protein [Sphingomonas sinipercae]QIL02402.1 EAL domain-containing protein [Sphingomonas sinipercae]